jgi:hypothetical protein
MGRVGLLMIGTGIGSSAEQHNCYKELGYLDTPNVSAAGANPPKA